MKIQKEPLTEAMQRRIYDGLKEHTIDCCGVFGIEKPISFYFSDENQSIISIVVVRLFWGALHIKYLWTHKGHRKKGYASKLMQAAFDFAQDNRCPFAFVETMNFQTDQAEKFYEKLGFTLELKRIGYAKNTTFCYMRKNFPLKKELYKHALKETNQSMPSVTFEKASHREQALIFSWLQEPHVMEFWDNTPEHKADIINFMEGRLTPSYYCDGQFVYWIAKEQGNPFALLMTIQETVTSKINREKLDRLSQTGHSYGIDYMIGNKEYIGKGYGARILAQFIDFFRQQIDIKADCFFIDPESDNPRAKHVYMKAGFQYCTDFVMSGDCSGSGKRHHLLVKRFSPNVQLIAATHSDYSLIKKMYPWYTYHLKLCCGLEYLDRLLHSNEKNTDCYIKKYFEEDTRKPFLIKVYDKTAGFVLINTACLDQNSQWNVGEFFIMGSLQRCGIGSQVANHLFDHYVGQWEVSVIPENRPALLFWEHIVEKYTQGQFQKEKTTVNYDRLQPQRIVFTLDTKGGEKSDDSKPKQENC